MAEANKGASVDMTAMALQALANYQNRPQVKAAINRALAYLKNEQKDDFIWHRGVDGTGITGTDLPWHRPICG